MNSLRSLCLFLTLASATPALGSAAVKVPLSASASGSLEMQVEIGGQQASFMLDTGAAMATINAELFDRIKVAGRLTRVRQIGARMADGRVRKLSVYAVQGVRLHEGCLLDDVEVVVVPGKGRNLLGMNVLAHFSPLTVHLDPPAVDLSQCAGPGSQRNFSRRNSSRRDFVSDRGGAHGPTNRLAPYLKPSSTYLPH